MSAQGLILFSGVTGSGKSTSIASMLQYINERRRVHIMPDGGLELGDELIDGAQRLAPSLYLDRDTGQRLLDALIDAGMKPTTNPPTDQMLEAQRQHIVFAERVADELMQRTLPRPNTTEVVRLSTTRE